MDTPSVSSQAEGIGHAIADKKPIIPLRQRSYAWTKDEVGELFGDFAHALGKGRSDYFLGLIVVARRGVRPEVVDGQQRLATCAMLLAAIRDFFVSQNPQPKLVSKYQTEFLIDYDTTSRSEVPHLKLNIDDAPFFMDYVLRPPDDPARVAITAAETKKNTKSKKPSHKLIREAAGLAREQVKTIVNGVRPTDQVNTLVRWVDFIRSQARVIWFEVPDYTNAYTIFETLNDRGLDLSKSDLIKNHLYDCVGERYEDIHHHWANMTGALETVSTKDIAATYIRHFWISTHGPVRERQLFDAIKGELLGGVDAAILLATSLAQHAALYAAILSSDHERWSEYGEEARRNISTLVMLKAERIRPLLLAVVKNFDKEEIKKAIRLFVNWTVRLIIAGGIAGTVEARIGELAKEVSDKKITRVKGLANSVNPKSATGRSAGAIPSDIEFEEAFASARVAQEQLARYYLHELEDMYKQTRAEGETTITTDRRETVCTLEHILPGAPSPEWGFTPDELTEALEDLTRIGNLALMHKKLNEDAANAPFPKKRPFYKKEEGVYLTSLLADRYAICKKWGREQIEERQRELAKLAVKTWPLKV